MTGRAAAAAVAALAAAAAVAVAAVGLRRGRRETRAAPPPGPVLRERARDEPSPLAALLDDGRADGVVALLERALAVMTPRDFFPGAGAMNEQGVKLALVAALAGDPEGASIESEVRVPHVKSGLDTFADLVVVSGERAALVELKFVLPGYMAPALAPAVETHAQRRVMGEELSRRMAALGGMPGVQLGTTAVRVFGRGGQGLVVAKLGQHCVQTHLLQTEPLFRSLCQSTLRLKGVRLAHVLTVVVLGTRAIWIADRVEWDGDGDGDGDGNSDAGARARRTRRQFSFAPGELQE